MQGKDLIMEVDGMTEFLDMPQQDIADCLGIHPVTLSKYRGDNKDRDIGGPLQKLIKLMKARPEIAYVLRDLR